MELRRKNGPIDSVLTTRPQDEVLKRPADPAELTKLYTDEAIRVIEEHSQSPFFLYLPHTMLHVPLGVSKEFIATNTTTHFSATAARAHWPQSADETGNSTCTQVCNCTTWRMTLGESKPVRNGPVLRTLRGMAILFQQEMRLDARPAGDVPHVRT
jgi:hypothetical protein